MLAEHKHNVIRERTKAGLESTRAKGRSGGIPKGLRQRYLKIYKEIKEMYDIYITDAIREMFQIKSQPTLYKILQYAGAEVKGFVKKKLYPYVSDFKNIITKKIDRINSDLN
ncbi:hypothetical protein [Chryseobacterium sp. M5A1_1a]